MWGRIHTFDCPYWHLTVHMDILFASKKIGFFTVSLCWQLLQHAFFKLGPSENRLCKLSLQNSCVVTINVRIHLLHSIWNTVTSENSNKIHLSAKELILFSVPSNYLNQGNKCPKLPLEKEPEMELKSWTWKDSKRNKKGP